MINGEPVSGLGIGHRAACLCCAKQAPKPLYCGLVGMKKDNLITLASRSSNAGFYTPEMVLKDALDYIGKRGSFKEGKQLLILALDRGEKGDDYSVSYIQAGMKMSECIALCEISKTLFLTEMNYIPGSYNEKLS